MVFVNIIFNLHQMFYFQTFAKPKNVYWDRPLPTFLFKRCIDILLSSITEQLNLSLQNGVFLKPLGIFLKDCHASYQEDFFV